MKDLVEKKLNWRVIAILVFVHTVIVAFGCAMYFASANTDSRLSPRQILGKVIAFFAPQTYAPINSTRLQFSIIVGAINEPLLEDGYVSGVPDVRANGIIPSSALSTI